MSDCDSTIAISVLGRAQEPGARLPAPNFGENLTVAALLVLSTYIVITSEAEGRASSSSTSGNFSH